LPPGEPRQPRLALALGVLLGLAALTYLNLALLLPVALLALWQGGALFSRASASLLLGFTLPTLPAAAFVAHVHVGLSNWTALFGLYGGDVRYGVIGWQNAPRGVYAFLRTLVLYPGLGLNDRTLRFLSEANTAERLAWLATYAAVGAAAAVPLWLAWRDARARRALSSRRLTLWIALFAAFAFWWVPSDLEFWVPVGVGWFLIVGLLLARGALPRWAAAIGIAVLLLANGRNLILPHHWSTEPYVHLRPPGAKPPPVR
jgi:hypothetical protein